MEHSRRRLTSRAGAVFALVVAVGGGGCAVRGGPPAAPQESVARAIERIAPTVSPEERARARDATLPALRALADARGHLLRGERDAARERLETARGRVEEARSLLPVEVVVAASSRGEPLRVEMPREPLAIPLSALDAETLERLRVHRPADARRLRVDLDALARRLERIRASPPPTLGDVVLAAAAALRFEGGPDSRVVDGVQPAESLAPDRPQPRGGGLGG